MDENRKNPVAKTRQVRDTMGVLEVPADAYYGAQTARAVRNFPLTGLRAHPEFVRAMAAIKIAAARSNAALGLLRKPPWRSSMARSPASFRWTPSAPAPAPRCT